VAGGAVVTRYAKDTDVSRDRSLAEISATVTKYGACGFMYGWEGLRASVGFRLKDRLVRFELPMPDPQSREFTHTPERGTPRSPAAATAAWEQASRQRFRALALAIKAKLEAVESGIATFEEEFLAHLVLPDGRTVGQHALPAVAAAFATGRVPRLLPAAGEPTVEVVGAEVVG
jgi:hypothetical protein